MKTILPISLITATLLIGCSEPIDESELESLIIEQTAPELIPEFIENRPIKPIDGENIGDYISRMESNISTDTQGSKICLSNFLVVLEQDELESIKPRIDDELINFLNSEKNSKKKIEIGGVIQKNKQILDCDQPQNHESIGKLFYSRILFSEDFKKARFILTMDYGFARRRFIVKVKNVTPPEAKTSELRWEIEKIISV